MQPVTIILAGTGASECVPAFRCRCSHCEEARRSRGKNLRLNSCAIIQDGDTLCLMDTPPQIVSMFRDLDIDAGDLDGVFITHRHEDHTLGIRSFLQGDPLKGFKTDSKLNLFMGAATRNLIKAKYEKKILKTGSGTETPACRINPLFSFQPVREGTLTFTPMETGHLKAKGLKEESLGFHVRNKKGINFVYLLDCPCDIPEETMEYLSSVKIDLLVSDCTFKYGEGDGSHGNIESCIRLKKTLKPGKMIISHIGHRNLNHKELSEIIEAEDIEAGYDGMIIRLASSE